METPGLLWTILFFVAAIGPLVFFHELGHYAVGRYFGVKADVFAIGFGKELAGWTDKLGTRWKLCALPLGGYVKFAGDMSAASTPDAEWRKAPAEEQAVMFQSKPVWQRALIVLAGPVANFILAIALYMGIFAVNGELRVQPIAAKVMQGSAAEKAGLQAGDRILAINDREITRFTEIAEYVSIRPNQLMTVRFERGGAEQSVTFAADEEQLRSRFGTMSSVGRLGLAMPRPEMVQLSFLELPGAAIYEVRRVLRMMIDGLGQIIMGYQSVKELGGPVMIAKLSGEMATLGFTAFLTFMALISINLGFINLLPVPMLDGGHLLFYGLEAIQRRPVSMAVQEWAYRAGFMALIGLMLFVTANDLVRFGLFG
jgi:regulator of sigma E protease